MGELHRRQASPALMPSPIVHPPFLPPATGFVPLLCAGRNWVWASLPFPQGARP